MKKATIKEAIVLILKNNVNGLTSKDIYNKIVEQRLYDFQAKEPISVVNHTIRKNCTGTSIGPSIDKKIFEEIANGKYKLKDQ